MEPLSFSMTPESREPLQAFAHAILDTRMSLATACFYASCLVVVFLILERIYKWLLVCRARSYVPWGARTAAPFLRKWSYTEAQFFTADGADAKLAAKRKAAMDELSKSFATRFAKSIQEEDTADLSDLRFTDMNRVPHPFQAVVRSKLRCASFVTSSAGPRIRDVDGGESIDLSGSYGVNVVGYDFYKECITKGWERVKELGPVLGPLHPTVRTNVQLLKQLSGMDEVSFHMSGTEAVMCAVRLCRFNTRRPLIVTFTNAYHGWWDGVQPAVGNERNESDVLVLNECSTASLAAIAARAGDIAAVLVSPYQAFHPNRPPPNDLTLMTGARNVDPKTLYAQWLQQLRAVCDQHYVPLVYDEVYSGFRMGPRGAQSFFGVPADMVVYGKTVAGGMPIGVVCGKRRFGEQGAKINLMERFDARRPLRNAYVIGTFSASPPVMGAMTEFLEWATADGTAQQYADAQARFDKFIATTNTQLEAAQHPVRLQALATVFTLTYTQPGRYHWMLAYYMRRHGLLLSWVGSGRLIVSLDWQDADYRDAATALLAACKDMAMGGWWDLPAGASSGTLSRRFAAEAVYASTVTPLVEFYRAIMHQKHVDHHASHSNLINQFLHLISSSIFLYLYYLCSVTFFGDYRIAMYWGLGSLFVRQAGHYVFEPPCHDKEQLMLGFDTRKKVKVCIGYIVLPFILALNPLFSVLGIDYSLDLAVADVWLVFTLAVVLGRVAVLWRRYSFAISMHWFLKFMTDPATDIPAYIQSAWQIFNPYLIKDAVASSFPHRFPEHVPSGKKAKSLFDQKASQ